MFEHKRVHLITYHMNRNYFKVKNLCFFFVITIDSIVNLDYVQGAVWYVNQGILWLVWVELRLQRKASRVY